MIKEATIVMILGMGTVFMVLLALLGLMTLGGRLAIRFARRPPDEASPGASSGAAATAAATAGDAPQERVAVAVAAARQHRARQERGVKA